jgi:hypothetical protein
MWKAQINCSYRNLTTRYSNGYCQYFVEVIRGRKTKEVATFRLLVENVSIYSIPKN